ncbi:MAG: DapH/DapD/GlmU-related protein [Pseudomonadota bacterium]
MRKISAGQTVFFLLLLSLIVVLAIGSAAVLLGDVALGDFRGVALSGAALLLIYLYAFVVYRLFLACLPLREGALAPGSRDEFVANVNILFYLLVFNSLIRSHVLPVPLLRLVYLALGARLGANSYSAGAILDPPLTHIGRNTLIGHDAVIFAHVIEGHKMELRSVHIGDGVTIGAMAIVMADVHIGHDAIVSAGAVVTKGSRIGPGEVWGGMPARLLKKSALAASERDPVR